MPLTLTYPGVTIPHMTDLSLTPPVIDRPAPTRANPEASKAASVLHAQRRTKASPLSPPKSAHVPTNQPPHIQKRRQGKRATMPDVMTRQGRLQAFVDVVQAFYRGDARPPEALAAIRELSKVHDDAGQIAEEKQAPRPEAIAAWILRHALQGQPIRAGLDLTAVCLAIRKALCVDLVIIKHGVKSWASGEGAQPIRDQADPQQVVVSSAIIGDEIEKAEIAKELGL